MENIKWLFFDLGSTLIDETECYKSRIDYIVQNNNIDRAEFVSKVYECAKTSAVAISSAAKCYGFAVPPWNNDLEKLYPSSENILQMLSKKYKLGVIANQTFGTIERLEKWGIGKYFDTVIASAEAGVSKPDLKIFKMAFEAAGCNPHEAVMIGDRLDNDIAPAKKLGMKTVWVRQGFAVHQNISDELQKPDYIIESIENILDIF